MADIITGDDPAALVGIDENRNVPALTGGNARLAAEAAEQVRENEMPAVDEEMDIHQNGSYVTMAVVDDIVISPPVYNIIFQLIAITDLCLALCL